MPYDRDQAIAALAEYYDFLTRLHVKSEDIRRPPSIEGLPEIIREHLSKLGKTDTVIDLLKHLLYVQNDYNDEPILIWDLSSCNDYTGWQFQQDILDGDTANYLLRRLHHGRKNKDPGFQQGSEV